MAVILLPVIRLGARILVAGGLIAGVALLASGCVERFLLVQSEPTGARVFLDAEEVGTSPVCIPFEHYGTREILLRYEDRTKSFASARRLVTLSPPWYERFPIDFVAEHLWPATITDLHEVQVTLEPLDAGALEARLRNGIGVEAPPGSDPAGTQPPQ